MSLLNAVLKLVFLGLIRQYAPWIASDDDTRCIVNKDEWQILLFQDSQEFLRCLISDLNDQMKQCLPVLETTTPLQEAGGDACVSYLCIAFDYSSVFPTRFFQKTLWNVIKTTFYDEEESDVYLLSNFIEIGCYVNMNALVNGIVNAFVSLVAVFV